MAGEVVPEQTASHVEAHEGVDDGVEFLAVRDALLAHAEDAAAQRRAVERAAFARRSILAAFAEGVAGGEEEVGCGWAEGADDAAVAPRAGLDGLACEQVGVDDGEGVRRGGEDGRARRFSRGYGAG